MTSREVPQEVTNAEVQSILTKLRDPRGFNKPVLMVNILAAMQGRNGGYPLNLYHPTLDAQQVFDDAQEESLTRLGYTRNYVHRHYPKALYRRNYTQAGTGYKFQDSEFIESITVKSQLEEDQKRSQPTPRMCSDWAYHPDELPQVPTEEDEDLVVKAANLAEDKRRLEARIKALEAGNGTSPAEELVATNQENPEQDQAAGGDDWPPPESRKGRKSKV